ncbi:arginase family enzyme [Evansella vedderi]|uniref:Arginase family enzyme n=1 Tax=Evansella vedderi TaxID=38282 RepID=A0ABT9ZZE4_9BACI|nr:arginase family protein [Evansella vedderi]MDQ0256619.1 arginase family enzyme [Evansella vedderi]
MSITHNEVTVLDFDHTYVSQKFLHDSTFEWIPMEDIPSTSRYCSNEARAEIYERLQHRRNKGITFIGNGNYHYVSLLLLQEIDSPFTLVLLDNHTDLQEPSFMPLLSCGSWVLHALESLPNLEKVVIVGIRPDFTTEQIPAHLRSKISIIPHNHILFQKETKLLSHIQSLIPTANIYISIDKDVLDETAAKTNWDHGKMQLATLRSILQSLSEHKSIIGVDICGEYPAIDFFDKEGLLATHLNEQANRTLLQTVKSCSRIAHARVN